MPNVIKVLNMLHNERNEAEYVSPAFVVDFACDRGMKLTSKEVTEISNVYGETNDPTNRKGGYLYGKSRLTIDQIIVRLEELKHQNHHSIEEEKWRIDEIISELYEYL